MGFFIFMNQPGKLNDVHNSTGLSYAFKERLRSLLNLSGGTINVNLSVEILSVRNLKAGNLSAGNLNVESKIECLYIF